MATMPNQPETTISVQGAEFVPGSLVIESHNGLLEWHGTVERSVRPGATVRLIIISGDKVYWGEALIKSLTIPGPDDLQPPTNEYFGVGPLARRTAPNPPASPKSPGSATPNRGTCPPAGHPATTNTPSTHPRQASSNRRVTTP